MKAIYTIINNNVYKLRQNANIPSSLSLKRPGTSSSMSIDQYNKTISQNVYINNMVNPGVKSNSEMCNDMIDLLRRKCITEIKDIQNFFKIYIDYSMFEEGREIEHSAIVRPMEPIDKIVPLGVATNNECVYRRVKCFNPTVDFRIRNSLPHGIMMSQKNNYVFKINAIAIFQDFSRTTEVHNSSYEVSYPLGAVNLQSNLNNMALIYSSEDEGIDIQEMSINFTPRKISLSFDIVMADYIVVYDNATIEAVLEENMESKYPPIITPPDIEGGGSDEGGSLIPIPDENVPADGDYTPDEDGYFDYYELCQETTPNALQVVEDDIPDSRYNPNKMIKLSMVLKDIPDVTVGEYVIRRESFIGLL